MSLTIKSQDNQKTITESSETSTNSTKITNLEARPTIYAGTSATPPSGWKNGDIYVQYS